MNSAQLSALRKVAAQHFERVESLATDQRGNYLLSVESFGWSQIFGTPEEYYRKFPDHKRKAAKRGK